MRWEHKCQLRYGWSICHCCCYIFSLKQQPLLPSKLFQVYYITEDYICIYYFLIVVMLDFIAIYKNEAGLISFLLTFLVLSNSTPVDSCKLASKSLKILIEASRGHPHRARASSRESRGNWGNSCSGFLVIMFSQQAPAWLAFPGTHPS